LKIIFQIKEWILRFLMILMAVMRSFVKENRISRNDIKRILFIQFGGLGDMVLITPAIRSINKNFPEAEISILGSNLYNSDFLFNFPNVVEIRELDIYALDMRQIFKQFFWKALFQTIRFLRKRRFDLLITFRSLKLIDWLFIEWVFVFFSRAGFTIGINPDYLPRHSVYCRWKIDSELKGQHYTESFLQLLEMAGIPACNRKTMFPIGKAAKKNAEILLSGITDSQPRVCIHPGGTRIVLEKELWHPSNYASIAKHLTQKGIFVIIVGSGEDLKSAETICKENPDCLDLTSRTTIEEMAAIIQRVDIFIGNDSGPFHIAAAVGTPAIGIFTRTKDEPEYYNYPMRNVFVFKSNFTEPPTVDGVLKKVNAILSK